VVIAHDVLYNKIIRNCEYEYRHNKSSFLKESEDSHDVGIWTRPRFTTAFSVPGPDILVNHPGFTDMERDTLAQL
jgi:hypothetical protein